MKSSYSPRHARRDEERIADRWKTDINIDLPWYRFLVIGLGIGIMLMMLRVLLGGNGFDRTGIQLLALPMFGCTCIWVGRKIYLSGFERGRNDG